MYVLVPGEVRVGDKGNGLGEAGEGRTVMLVDDDEAIVDTLRDVLEAEGYHVEGYTDPIRALERLRAITPPGMVPRIHLSLTDEPPLAQAFVIISAEPAPPDAAP